MKRPVDVSVNLRAIVASASFDSDSRSVALTLGVRYLREINEGGIGVQERERERERERDTERRIRPTPTDHVAGSKRACYRFRS